MGKSMAPKSDFKWFGTDSIRPIIVFGLSLRLFWATTFTTSHFGFIQESLYS